MTEKCRICLTKISPTDTIALSSNLNQEISVLHYIKEFSSVEISEEDGFPQSICKICIVKLDECYTFRKLIILSDKKLKAVHLSNDNTSDKKPLQAEDEDSLINDDSFSVKYEESENNDGLNTKENDEKQSKFLLNQNISKQKNIKKGSIKEERIHQCEECQKTFKKADHLNNHMIYKHYEKQYKCEICGKKFARKYDLIYHNRVHTGERPFTCEKCGKSFASSSYFYLHKRIHSGEKKNKCEFCPKAFINSDQLRIHIRQKHTGEKPFICEKCSHAFTSSSAVFRHKRDVHDEKVECPVCSKLYSSRVLKDHIRRHKEKEEGIKRYNCEVCNKKFTCGTSKKRHMVIHSGEKAFKCEVCEKAFNQRSTLQTHMRIHSQIMPFHCEFCNKSFRYKHHLKVHYEKNHNERE